MGQTRGLDALRKKITKQGGLGRQKTVATLLRERASNSQRGTETTPPPTGGSVSLGGIDRDAQSHKVRRAKALRASSEEKPTRKRRKRRPRKERKPVEKFPSNKDIRRLAKTDPETALELLTVKNLALLIYRVRKDISGEPFTHFHVEAWAMKKRRQLMALHLWMIENSLPVVAFLSAQFRSLRGRSVWVNALRGKAALRRWERAERTVMAEEEAARIIARVEGMSATERIDQDFQDAEGHLAYVARLWGLAADDESLAWLERSVLPGVYLLTVESIVKAWRAGSLEPVVCERMSSAWTLLKEEARHCA